MYSKFAGGSSQKRWNRSIPEFIFIVGGGGGGRECSGLLSIGGYSIWHPPPPPPPLKICSQSMPMVRRCLILDLSFWSDMINPLKLSLVAWLVKNCEIILNTYHQPCFHTGSHRHLMTSDFPQYFEVCFHSSYFPGCAFLHYYQDFLMYSLLHVYSQNYPL